MSISFHLLGAEPFPTVPAHVLFLGEQAEVLKIVSDDELLTRVLPAVKTAHLLQAIAGKLSPAFDSPASLDTWLEASDGGLIRVTLAALPSGPSSRHNAPSKCHAAADVVRANSGGTGILRIFLALASPEHALALGSAVARVFPLYSAKSTVKASREVEVILGQGPYSDSILSEVASISTGIQLSCRLVDAPTNELHTDSMVAEALAVRERLGDKAKIEVISGKELLARGLGGIYSVGMAAVNLPALVILSTVAESTEKSIVLIGKGIVYDTGGLSIKSKSGMPGMKRDMGGAAAVLAAFEAAVKLGSTSKPLHAILCLAENSVDSVATRPDDIIKFYSGKTVEINNTDAEGRLVLADGAAWATKNLNPSVLIDMATLTGAQSIATGKRHAAIYTNSEELEKLAVDVGRYTGDLTHPLPYAPEFFRSEFRSAVADMKNSVANRENGQASCAGEFIGSHITEYVQENQWLHIDMAGPVHAGERATGYGVALLVGILQRL